MRWDPERLAYDCDGRLLRHGSRPIASAFVDSRNALEDGLFIPLVAARDSHDFIAAAVEAGASAFLCAAGKAIPSPSFLADHDLTVVEVDDTLRALTALAHRSARNGGGPRVAITGSNGKTTTRSYVGAVLACAYPRLLQTQGNFNNHIGLPLSLLGTPHEPQARVLELGMSALGENRHLASMLEPTISVVTSIALEHLETMGSLAAIAAAETEPFEFIPPDGALIIPDDEALIEGQISPNFPGRIWRFGATPQADLRLVEVTVGSPTRGKVAFADGMILDLEVQGMGRHNLRNACAALAVGEHLGIDRLTMARAIADVLPVGDRGRVIPLGRHMLIADCYNANPGSMVAGLEMLRDLAQNQGRRAIAVLGDMLELGPQELALHRQLGESVADYGVAHLIGLGPLTEATAQAASHRGVHAVNHVGDDVDRAVAFVLAALTEQNLACAVLFKGSRGLRIERVLHGVLAAAAQ